MKKFLAVAVIAAMTLLGGSAFAYDVKVDDDTFAKVGVKGQTRILMLEDAALNTKDPAIDFTVPNARIYFSGQVTNLVKFGFNFDMSRTVGGTAGVVNLADGSVMLDFAKEAKVIVGVYRMAVSRVALQDSYTYILPDAPMVAGGRFLSNSANFRNAGVTLWGDLIDGMIRYNVGLWDGSGNTQLQLVGNNPEDSLGMSARLVFNFLDPEKGYTCLGCYLGKAKTLNVGLGYLTQAYGATLVPMTSSVSDKTYTVTTVDAYYDADNVTAEAGYYMYDYDTVAGNPTGMYLQAAYVIGNIQPALRYEIWDADMLVVTPGTDYSRITVGANYLIDGQNAKISLAYMMHSWDKEGVIPAPRTTKDYADLTLQLQVQF